MQQIIQLRDQLILFFVTNGLKWAVAIAIFVAGFWLAKKMGGLVEKVCQRRSIDVTLTKFFVGFSRVLVIGFSLIIALSKAEIEITPFVALLGASAFGLSLAVQGPISNYGSGIVLIITRPFKVGDTLTINGLTGLVEGIHLGNTRMLNEDGEVITIPNRNVLGEIFINSKNYTMMELSVGIEYEADPEQAIACIEKALSQVPGLVKERPPVVGIDAFADSSINIGYRLYIETSKLHETRFAANLAVHHALKDAGIGIPFPQRVIHQKHS